MSWLGKGESGEGKVRVQRPAPGLGMPQSEGYLDEKSAGRRKAKLEM